MARAFIILCLALSIVFVVTAVAESAGAGSEPQNHAGNNVAKKLGRGMANILMWPCEIFNQMGKANDGGGPVAALTWGLASGIGMSAVRLAVGVYEVATFPIPCPPGYKPILADPDFYFKDETF